MKLEARWPTGATKTVTVRRRWFPWGTDNVTIGDTIFLRHPEAPTAGTLRHEVTHALQYERYGFWRFLGRYLTSAGFRAAMEFEARMAAKADTPTFRAV